MKSIVQSKIQSWNRRGWDKCRPLRNFKRAPKDTNLAIFHPKSSASLTPTRILRWNKDRFWIRSIYQELRKTFQMRPGSAWWRNSLLQRLLVVIQICKSWESKTIIISLVTIPKWAISSRHAIVRGYKFKVERSLLRSRLVGNSCRNLSIESRSELRPPMEVLSRKRQLSHRWIKRITTRCTKPILCTEIWSRPASTTIESTPMFCHFLPIKTWPHKDWWAIWEAETSIFDFKRRENISNRIRPSQLVCQKWSKDNLLIWRRSLRIGGYYYPDELNIIINEI